MNGIYMFQPPNIKPSLKFTEVNTHPCTNRLYLNPKND